MGISMKSMFVLCLENCILWRWLARFAKIIIKTWKVIFMKDFFVSALVFDFPYN